MFPFRLEAESELRALKDEILIATNSFAELTQLYGETSKIRTNDFFSAIKIFLASWQKAAKENFEATERQRNLAARKEVSSFSAISLPVLKSPLRFQARERQQQENAQRQAASEEGRSQIDDLLSRLKEGELVSRGKRAARRKNSTDFASVATPLSPEGNTSSDDYADIAKSMIKDLQLEGLEELLADKQPATPTRRTMSMDGRERRRISISGSQTPASVSTTNVDTIPEET